jgi:ABC-2 type transport system permease protein
MNTTVERTVLWLTWRQLFARRRAILLIAFALTPALIALAFRGISADPETEGMGFLITLLRQIVIGIIVPVAAVIFGTGAFGAEVDDGTLVYLFVKPIARWRIVAVKYVGAVLSTATIAIPAIALPWLLVRNPDLPASVPLSFLLGALAGCVIYSAIFVALGIATRRALVAGLLYVVGIELVLSQQIVGIKSVSVREISLAIVQASAHGSVTFPDHRVTLATVWTMGSLLLAGSLALAIWKLRRYELSERI